MFSGSSLSFLALPEGVLQIGERAFKDCQKLDDLILPASLVTIGKEAFSGCCKLQAVVLPQGLTVLGAAAFANCGALTEITIPNIDPAGVFAGCPIATVYFYGTTEESQTYICPAFPYSSNVEIYCRDGIPIRKVHSISVF